MKEKNLLLEKLKTMEAELDLMQESNTAQNDEDLMWELGEIIGSINNAIDILENN